MPLRHHHNKHNNGEQQQLPGGESNFKDMIAQTLRIPSATFTERNLPDMTNKVVMVTGGYAGVGKEVASILYSKNATVYIAGRNETKARPVLDAMRAAHPSSKGALHFLSVDLADLTTIKAAAEEYMRREPRLHWLNQNAGVMTPPDGSKGAQGMNLQYQTNVLGPFLFAKLLQPVLARTAAEAPLNEVRVSWAGSIAINNNSPHGGVNFTPDGKELAVEKDKMTTYAVSKAADYLLACEFARRFHADGVLHNTYNPGLLKTELQRHYDGAQALMIKAFPFMLAPPINGAYTELYAGFSTDITLNYDQAGFVIPWGRKWMMRKDIAAENGPGGKGAKLYDWCDSVTAQYA